MTIEEYLKEMKPGYKVTGGSDAHLVMHQLADHARRVTMEMNNAYHTNEELTELMKELTGNQIGEGFGIFPPFYSDCGRNIHIGNHVFINAGCKFQD